MRAHGWLAIAGAEASKARNALMQMSFMVRTRIIRAHLFKD
jgi:hypothetical protein